jgi:hypothetical protein
MGCVPTQPLQLMTSKVVTCVQHCLKFEAPERLLAHYSTARDEVKLTENWLKDSAQAARGQI